MKSQTVVKILCSVFIVFGPRVAMTEEAPIRSLKDDPVGAWIEKNAARYGLFVEPTPVQENRAARPSESTDSVQVPSSMIHSMSTSTSKSTLKSGSAAKPGSQATPPANQPATESDAIKAFFSDTGLSSLFGVPTNPEANTDFIASKLVPEPRLKVPAPSFRAKLMPIPEVVIERKKFEPPAEALEATHPAAQIAAVMKDLDFSPNCSGFATSAGFGSWGQTVIRELTSGNANSLLQGTDDLRRACPNYDLLSNYQRSHVWVKIMASMAFLESSCNPRALGRGPNGVAAGLTQLHQGHEHKAAPGCNRGDSRSPITSIQCTISIIETQFKRTNALFSRDTHFGVLRPQGDLIRTKSGNKRVVKARVVAGAIRELPFCQRN